MLELVLNYYYSFVIRLLLLLHYYSFVATYCTNEAAFTRRHFHSKTAQFDTGYAVRLHVFDEIECGYALYPVTFVSDNLSGYFKTASFVSEYNYPFSYV